MIAQLTHEVARDLILQHVQPDQLLNHAINLMIENWLLVQALETGADVATRTICGLPIAVAFERMYPGAMRFQPGDAAHA